MAQWREIQTLEEWNQILESSQQTRTLIFKHSTRCPISTTAWNEYQTFVRDTTRNDIAFTMVKVIQFREVSNAIEQALHIKHESPQAILMGHQEPIRHVSHQKITKSKLGEIIEN